MYCRLTVWRLRVDKSVVTLALYEYSPLQSFAKAWMQGLESVRICVVFLFSTIYGAQCCTDNEITNASTSQGSHFMWWGLSLAEKKPPRSILSCRMIYSTAPIPFVTAPSVVTINLSSGHGTVIDFNPCNADCAREKDCRRSLDQQICALDSLPAVAASRPWSKVAWYGRHDFKCLKAWIQERKPRTVLGGWAVTKGDILCGETLIWPLDHTHPRITVDVGHTTVCLGWEPQIIGFKAL